MRLNKEETSKMFWIHRLIVLIRYWMFSNLIVQETKNGLTEKEAILKLGHAILVPMFDLYEAKSFKYYRTYKGRETEYSSNFKNYEDFLAELDSFIEATGSKERRLDKTKLKSLGYKEQMSLDDWLMVDDYKINPSVFWKLLNSKLRSLEHNLMVLESKEMSLYRYYLRTFYPTLEDLKNIIKTLKYIM